MAGSLNVHLPTERSFPDRSNLHTVTTSEGAREASALPYIIRIPYITKKPRLVYKRWHENCLPCNNTQ